MKKSVYLSIVLGVIFIAAARPSLATGTVKTFCFQNFNPADDPPGNISGPTAASLFVDVSAKTHNGKNGVLFNFRNTGVGQSAGPTIGDIYFDVHDTQWTYNQLIKSPSILAEVKQPGNPSSKIDYLYDSTVDLDTSLDLNDAMPIASKLTLPQGTNADPPFDGEYRFRYNGNIKYGIDPGERLELFFCYGNGQMLQDILDAMEGGDLRVGLHVQRMGDNQSYSDSYINCVPEPGSMALLGLGALGFCRRLRRRPRTP